MVNSHISEWNSLERNLVTLYDRLVALGMECRDGNVYLADIEEGNEDA